MTAHVPDKYVEAAARELALLDDGDPWPSNVKLGGHPLLGTRDDEYRHAMREQASELLSVAATPWVADELERAAIALLTQADQLRDHAGGPRTYRVPYIPPEPPVGTVVEGAGDVMYLRRFDGGWLSNWGEFITWAGIMSRGPVRGADLGQFDGVTGEKADS